MTVMYSFCFWFSVRLGSIIVALTCVVQCVAALIACGIGIDNLARTSKDLDYLIKVNDLLIANGAFMAMRDDPETYLKWFISILTIYLCICVLLVYGAFKCNIYMIYPFVFLDFLRLITMTLAFVLLLFIIKRNTLTLDAIIGTSILGVFILLYLWYQWFCTVALVQIIRTINKMDQSNQALQATVHTQTLYGNNPRNISELQEKHLQKYNSMNKLSPSYIQYKN